MVFPRDDPPASREDHRGSGLPVDYQGWLACATAVVGFILCLVGWRAGGGAVSLPWAPTLNLRLSAALDGLAVLYALLATGIGALVFAYGSRYLNMHLEHEGRPAVERWRFWPWMALFAVAMVGLATAQDLVLLFVFFDITAVCSYFLIGFDRAKLETRASALMALLVTAVSAVAMLVAAVLLYASYGTFSIPELLSRDDSRRRAIGCGGAGQECPGSFAFLATEGNGGPHPCLGLPALRSDGRGRRARSRTVASAAQS